MEGADRTMIFLTLSMQQCLSEVVRFKTRQEGERAMQVRRKTLTLTFD